MTCHFGFEGPFLKAPDRFLCEIKSAFIELNSPPELDMRLKRRINFLASHLRHFRSPSVSKPYFFSSCFKPFHSSLHSALVPPLVLHPSLPPSLPLSGPPDCEPKGHLSPESPVYLNRSPPFDIHLLGDGRRKKRKNRFSSPWLAGRLLFRTRRRNVTFSCRKL